MNQAGANSSLELNRIKEELERARLKSALKERLLRRSLQQNSEIWTKLAKKQEELRILNAQLERAKELLKQSFQRYVSPHIVDEVLRAKQPINLGGQIVPATILIADIRHFTDMAESVSPERLVAFLNAYFAVMVDIVLKNGGALDKFMGDALMAVFGVPIPSQDDAYRAVRCAWHMQRELTAFNQQRMEADKLPPVRIGTGIATGLVVSGNIGSPQRMDYTVIGPVVNYAQRLEQLTKEHDAPILICSATYEQIKGRGVKVTCLGPISIRGKKEQMVVYAIRDLDQR